VGGKFGGCDGIYPTGGGGFVGEFTRHAIRQQSHSALQYALGRWQSKNVFEHAVHDRADDQRLTRGLAPTPDPTEPELQVATEIVTDRRWGPSIGQSAVRKLNHVDPHLPPPSALRMPDGYDKATFRHNLIRRRRTDGGQMNSEGPYLSHLLAVSAVIWESARCQHLAST
jgi:hypothetical protein